MKSPKEIRKARLALIKGIVKKIRKQLDIPGIKVYSIRREFGYSVESSDNRKTGYGIGFKSFFRGVERRFIEIDCTCDGTSLDSPLVIETFDNKILKKAVPTIDEFLFRGEIEKLFSGVSFNNYGQHVSYRDQRVGVIRESLNHMRNMDGGEK